MKLIMGLLLATLGGGIQGSFVYPMKFMKHWKWENGWFVFTLTCCLIIPVTLAFSTTPGLLDIYRNIDAATMWLVFLSGIAWGIGVVLFGLGVDFLGMALGIAIITGLNAAFGTLFPILFLPTNSFSPNTLIFLGIGLLVLIFGVSQVSAAGKLRENEQQKDKQAGAARKVSFKVGLLVCIIASVFCPATNFAVFFGQPISEAVTELGTVAPYNVGYAQLLPYFIGGFIVNSIYCIYLFSKNKSFKNYYKISASKNMLLGVSMSALFIVGMVLYTIALTIYIKDIGAVVGWPLFMAATIIASSILGLISGEWRHVGRRAFNKLYSGIGLLILSIILVSLSNLFV